jgi:hypothetical protein
MSMMWSRAMMLSVTFALAASVPAFPQDAGAPAAAATSAAAAQEDDPDLDPNPAQPDFTLVNLPTTLRLPRFKSAFRVTHRFGRPLGSGDFADLIQDFFGFDSGALIGLEYRFGIFRGAQLGIHRTSDRTIEFFGQYDLLGLNPDRPFAVSALATIDGTNNFRDSYTPVLGVLASYQFGNHGAVYVEPIWVNNSNIDPLDVLEDNDTFIVGLGARLRVRPTVYLLAEFTPRVAGYAPGDGLGSFGIEKRVGGHAFQLNFSNGFGTTMGQVARGSVGDNDWFIGFNISRKFF